MKRIIMSFGICETRTVVILGQGSAGCTSARGSGTRPGKHRSPSLPTTTSTHHEVYIVVFISEVLHQLLKTLLLSAHLQKKSPGVC